MRAWSQRVLVAATLSIGGLNASCSPSERDFGQGGSSGTAGSRAGADVGGTGGFGGMAQGGSGEGEAARGGMADNGGKSNGGATDDGGEAGSGGAPEDCQFATCECRAGETQACGPEASVGICKPGERQCEQGAWGECVGAVEAAERDCTSALDNDCDGEPDNTIDDSCKCAPGTKEACGEHPGADGKGPCKAGTHECVGSGSTGVWGACVGSVGPQMDDSCLAADSANDLNCNGSFKDGCECITGQQQACGNCGMQTCDGAIGKWNKCVGNGSVRCDPAKPDNKQSCSNDGVYKDALCASGSVCTGASAACKLRDQEACGAPADCATGGCNTFLVDDDEDGYSPSTATKSFCGTVKDGYVRSGSNKGKDCDDTSAATFPGASELCDGRDNDCNDAIDNGLPLKGKATSLSLFASGANVAWSPTTSLFGVVYSNDDASANSKNASYVSLSTDNVTQSARISLTTNPVEFSVLGLAWGGADFGIARRSPGNGITFRHMTAAGVGGTDVIVQEPNNASRSGFFLTSVARIPTKNWLVTWRQEVSGGSDGIYMRTISPTDVRSAAVDFAGSDGHAAATTSVFGVASSSAANGVILRVLSNTLTDVAHPTLSTSSAARSSVVASDGTDFGVAWLDGSDLFFSRVRSDGGVVCTSAALSAGGFVPSDMASTKRGFVIASGSGKVEILEALSTCKWDRRFEVAPGTGKRASIAGGDGGFAVAWDAGSQIYTRTFGPNYCD